jgi:two-component system sensor histidine kinase MprB
LRARLAAALACVALTIGLLSAFAAYIVTERQLQSSLDDSLRATAASVTDGELDAQRSRRHGGREQDERDAANDGNDGNDDNGNDDNERNDADDAAAFDDDVDVLASSGCPPAGFFEGAAAAQLVSDTGEVTACIEGAARLPTASDASSSVGSDATVRTVDVDGASYRVLSTPWPSGGRLHIARDLEENQEVLDGLRRRLLLVVGAGTAIAALLGWFAARGVVRPVLRLRDEAHRIASTLDFSRPPTVAGPSEVVSLGRSFAAMLDAVRRSQEQQRRLVADASHEMRTPLTSLRSNAELLARIDELPRDDVEPVVHDVVADVEELATLIGELSDLASDLATAEEPETVSLAELARLVADRVGRRAGRTIDVVELDTHDVVGRPRLLERAIGNLVDNAVKYSDSTDPITVSVDGGRVTVSDRGPGIPEADLPHVFERFFRAVTSRTQPGSGLGLAIVDEVARIHGGSVFAANRAGGGAEVGFAVPVSGARTLPN